MSTISRRSERLRIPHNAIYSSLRWVGFRGEAPSQVVLIDDVLTSGTSYRACKRLIREHHPNMDVIGLFWTRCIWKNSAAEDFAEDIEE
jgi:predicted amidophosphoribosyltransferase